MTDTAPPTIAPQALVAKLAAVYDAVGFVEKRGENKSQGYTFAQALDVTRDIRAALRAEKMILLPPSLVSVTHEPIGTTRNGATILLTTAITDYTFACQETGETWTARAAGTGSDQNGDKGLYKAQTGGLKYLLLVGFMLPTTDDPEHDALSSSDGPGDAKTQADAERPAATRIPLDRAKAIAEQAVKVGAATWGEGEDDVFTPGPVLKAQLAALGVEKIGALDVDQAEDVEKLLSEEEQAQGEGASA